MLAILRSRFAEPRPAARNGIAARPTRAPALADGRGGSTEIRRR
jgi:hypothetical protein